MNQNIRIVIDMILFNQTVAHSVEELLGLSILTKSPSMILVSMRLRLRDIDDFMCHHVDCLIVFLG